MLYFDFETTNLDHGSALNPANRIIMVSWAEDDGPVKHYVGPILDAAEFWKAYERQPDMCAFNCKFEMHWLARLGADVHTKEWHDPMLAEYVILGNQRKPLNQGAVCARYGLQTKDPVVDRLMKLGVCPSDMPQKRLLARNIRDVRTMRELFSRQCEVLDKLALIAVYTTRVRLTPVLVEIERNGMQLDPERVRVEYDKYAARKAQLERDLDELTGGINLRSTDQLATFLYVDLKFPERKNAQGKPMRNKPSKSWPDGKPKTDKATLQWLSNQATTDKQKRFIALRSEYGQVNAALSKNLEFFQGVCDNYDCVFHAQLNQTVTATHRLSSSGLPIDIPALGRRGVQFQNMPREFKKLFTAPEGYVIAECDQMQLEFRTAAFLGNDKQALKDIHDPDFDAHVTSASVMNQIPYRELLDRYRAGDKAAKQMRQAAKPDTFKPLYGGTKGTPEQERWYKEFQRRYSGVYGTQEGWLAEVMTNDGELVLPWGMRFRWNFKVNRHGTPIDPVTGKPIGPAVFNYPVQSLATAEIVPIALTELFQECRKQKLDVKFVNTVHDSVICIVAEKDLPQFTEIVKLAFTTRVYVYLREHYGIDFRVPLGVEMIAGKHWGEGEETKHDDVTVGGHKK